MVKSNVKVFVRTRPTATKFDGFKTASDGQSITVKVPKQEDAGIINNQQENFTFKFDGVLENVSQEAVYTAAAHEVVDSLLSGYNGTIFCYGQTGSGKTFSMSGDLRAYQHRGVIPRAIHHVFKEIDMRVDKLYKVQVSYLELYNDQMYDLLAENPGTSDSLSILEDSNGSTYVRGLTRVPVHSEDAALEQFFVGEQGRSVAGHVLNSASSRSHVVYTIHLELRTSEAASERAVLSKLHLVDLAGSERTKKTNVKGQALKEAQFINKSLSFLEQTVNALSRKESYVPFRQTKLTAVLRDALGGNCKTVMVANVWPEPTHVEETLSTLRFASRVRTLVTDLSMSESTEPALLLRKYERQIKELKQELAMRDTLSGRGRINYEDMSDEEAREVLALVRRFLQGDADVEELPSDSLKRVRDTYKACRTAFQAMKTDMAAQISQAVQRASDAGQTQAVGGTGRDLEGAVGDVDRDAGRGFTIGQAPEDARPTSRYDAASRQGARTAGGESARSPTSMAGVSRGEAGFGFSSPRGGHDGDDGMTVSIYAAGTGSLSGSERNAAFMAFKREQAQGQELANALRDQAAQVKMVKAQVKELANGVNIAKHEVDSLSEQLAMRRGLQGPRDASSSEVLDAEQYGIMQQLKAAKAKYRQDFEALKEARSGLEPLLQSEATTRKALVEEFNKWAASGGSRAYMEEDELDPGEAFERMQLGRIIATDPDSTAYHTARRKTGMAGNGGARASAATFGGVKAAAVATRKKEEEYKVIMGLKQKA